MSELIVFYSRRDDNYVNGQIKTLPVGNTERVALLLQQATGADLFQIEPVIPYSPDYSLCINQALADQRRDARPELASYPENLEGYDTIYLGYPNYWGTLPMAVFTLLERLDFSGKRILLFCTHEGDGFGHSVEDVERLCPGAAVEAGPAIRGGCLEEAETVISGWLKEHHRENRQLRHDKHEMEGNF